MGSSGSGSGNLSPYAADPTQLAAWMQTSGAQQYAGQYNPANSYYNQGGNIIAANPNTLPANMEQFSGTNVNAMMAAFNAWQAGNAQTQQNWQSYTETAAANEGGEGDNTITSGVAVSQRNQILGSLANAGNPQPNGLGSAIGMPGVFR